MPQTDTNTETTLLPSPGGQYAVTAKCARFAYISAMRTLQTSFFAKYSGVGLLIYAISYANMLFWNKKNLEDLPTKGIGMYIYGWYAEPLTDYFGSRAESVLKRECKLLRERNTHIDIASEALAGISLIDLPITLDDTPLAFVRSDEAIRLTYQERECDVLIADAKDEASLLAYFEGKPAIDVIRTEKDLEILYEGGSLRLSFEELQQMMEAIENGDPLVISHEYTMTSMTSAHVRTVVLENMQAILTSV